MAAEIPIAKHFSQERIKDIHKYVGDRLDSLVRGLRGIRQEKVSAWRKVYYGTPREKTKSFPWQNASNVVIQLVGSFCDQMVAKIVMGTFGLDPLFVADLAGEWKREERAEEQRKAIEDWLGIASLEPTRLNLLPKYTIWARTFVKYGFGAIKCLPELTIEKVAASEKENGKGVSFTQHIRHDGPVVYPIRFEDFLMPATTIELERAPFLAQRAVMERFDVEALKHDPTYDKKMVEEVLKNPTRQGPDKNQREIEDESGARTDSDATSSNWDIYECYYVYQMGGQRFHIISTCCADDAGTSPKFMKDVFNWIPDNSIPFTGARLGSDGERAYGFGFCEMLGDYQEEVSAIHNRRGDAATAANTNVFRIDTGTQLDSQFSIYPMATIPGAKDSFEVIPIGRVGPDTIKDEQMVLQEAQDRVGVGPSSSGQGAGTVNKKGAYSAMGTFAVMQEGNTRANLNVTEFRQSHYSFGRLALLYYSHFGVSKKDIDALGLQGKWLEKALDSYKSGRLLLPIRAATGSVNKEIEKQNLMLLLNNTRAHWQMVNQLMQSAQNPMAPPEMQDYMIQVILASNLLMKKIARDFGIQDPSAILPEPLGIQDKGDQIKAQFEAQKQQQARPPQLTAGPGGQPGLPQVQAPGAPTMGTGEPSVTQ